MHRNRTGNAETAEHAEDTLFSGYEVQEGECLLVIAAAGLAEVAEAESRAVERFADMPVVVASSSAKPPAHVNLEHLGVARYVPKPPDLESFLEIGALLKEILVQSQTRRAEG